MPGLVFTSILIITSTTVVEAYDLFDKNKLRSFNLLIADEDLSKLRELPIGTKDVAKATDPHFHGKQKVLCSLTLDYGTSRAQTFSDLQVMYKGHGSLAQCCDHVTGALKEGTASCRLASMKVKAKSGGVHGLTTFNFHGMQDDASLMKERLSYTALTALGQNISRAVGVVLFINGKEHGIFNLVEAVGKEWLEHRGLKGTLYNQAWMDTTDVDAYDSSLAYGRKGAAQPLVDLLREAKQCGTPTWRDCDVATARKITRKYLNEDTWIDALVGSRLFYNFDGFWTMYYNAANRSGNHNFFIFLNDATPGKISMISWDYSEAFHSICELEDASHADSMSMQQPLQLMWWWTCWLPPWFYIPTESERPWVCDVRLPARHFTCDPVGLVMALSFGEPYLEMFKRKFGTDMRHNYSPLQWANEEVYRWREQYRPHVALASANGGLPKVNDFEWGVSITLQLFAAGLMEGYTRVSTGSLGATWTRPPGYSPLGQYLLSLGLPNSDDEIAPHSTRFFPWVCAGTFAFTISALIFVAKFARRQKRSKGLLEDF